MEANAGGGGAVRGGLLAPMVAARDHEGLVDATSVG